MNVFIKLQAFVLLLQCCKAQYFQEAIYIHPAQKQYFPEVQRSYYQNQYDIHNGPSNHRRHNFNSDGPGSCECSCKKCVYKPTNCCMMICNSCQQEQPQQELLQTMQPQLAQSQQPSLSLFMVPLPVPYLVHPSKTESSSTTSAKSIESTTSTTPALTTTTTKRLTTRKTTTSATKTTTTKEAQITTPFKRTRTGRQPEVLKFERNPRCSARSQCFRNYMDYEDNVNLIEYKHLRSKAFATVTIDSIKRNLDILNNIRPTIGMKVRSLMVTHKKNLPKYGLVQILPADEAEIMMQSY